MIVCNVVFLRIRLIELMVLFFVNFGGKVYGGVILLLMDKVVYVCVSKYVGVYCVIVIVDGVEFLQFVEVGDLFYFDVIVYYVGNIFLVVGIKVIMENIKINEVKYINNSFFIMVVKDDSGIFVLVFELELFIYYEMCNFVMVICCSKI